MSELNEAERIALIATLSNSDFNTIERELAQRGLSYDKVESIEKMREETEFKLNVRNILGV